MKHVAIIGSTGSIGTQTLEIARWNQDIKICALSAGRNIDLLEKQAREFRPEIVGLWDEKLAEELKDRLKDMDIRVVSGMDGLIEIAEYKTSDILVTAIVGMIGIRPTVAAIKAGKDIALANKETLVTAGHIIMPLAKEKEYQSFRLTVNIRQSSSHCREIHMIPLKNSVDSIRWTISWQEQRVFKACEIRGRIKTSKLEHGKKNHH